MSIHQGYVSIVGKPNVGKSTLINQILQQKLAITSFKPQTTRNKIMGVYKDHNSHIIFIDTPGLHNPKNKLDLFLNSEVKNSLKLSDITLFLLDPTRRIDDEDMEIIKQLNSWNVKKTIFLITKSDIASLDKINVVKEFILQNFTNPKYFIISSTTKKGIENLLLEIKNNLDALDELIFPDSEQFELSDKFVINEIIRESIIKLFRQEVPYATAVFTNSVDYEKERNFLRIKADIIVEKESQKPIIIGKGGSMIKKIGIDSRSELLKIFECKIHLELFVKVKESWRDNNSYIIDLGYKK